MPNTNGNRRDASHDGSRSDQDERLSPPGPERSQPRTACAGQLIDGEAVARAEPAIADGEPDFRAERADQPTEEMSE